MARTYEALKQYKVLPKDAKGFALVIIGDEQIYVPIMTSAFNIGDKSGVITLMEDIRVDIKTLNKLMRGEI